MLKYPSSTQFPTPDKVSTYECKRFILKLPCCLGIVQKLVVKLKVERILYSLKAGLTVYEQLKNWKYVKFL